MAILIFKIIYGIYFGGVMFYGLHLISMLLFSKLCLLLRLERFAKGVFISLTWPIMILSSGGIKILTKNINKF